ncbi:MAG: helix-turn-helix domain-containing protein [Acidimicrobiales bacterium]
MSVAVMSTCWRYSRAKGTDLLVLLALADIADDNGECWPSIRHLARKCRLDERTTQRRIRSLEALEEVVVIIGGGKSSTRGGVRSNRYQIVVHVPDEIEEDGGESPPPANRHPGASATQTPAHMPPMTPAPVPPESSIDPPVEPSTLSRLTSQQDGASSDPREKVVQDALALIANRRLKKRRATGTPIVNQRAYLRTVLEDATEELSAELTKRWTNHPTWTAEELACQFEEPFDPYTRKIEYL